MKPYFRLTFSEREELSRWLATGYSLRSIAQNLGRAPSSLCRELQRNSLSRDNYRALGAQRRASSISHHSRKQQKLNQHPNLRQIVLDFLAQRWSPEQIAKRLPIVYPKDPTMRISHETIYTYLYVLPRGHLKREIIACLRQGHHVRRQRNKRRLKTNPIQDLISIEERPKEVRDRTLPGHWEGDLIMGKLNASALGTLVERVTRFTLLVVLKTKDATSVRRAFAHELRTLPRQLKRSLTYDQGQEMREHRLFTQKTKMRVYFAHPHCPWERGTNENTNGLIRQFFPKGTNFRKISRHQIKTVQTMLNSRPRKVLNWRTPSEIFHGLLH